jgi:hypothetical protein
MQFPQDLECKSIDAYHCILFNNHLTIAIYDIIFACKQVAKKVELKKIVSKKLETKDLEKLSFIFGNKS